MLTRDDTLIREYHLAPAAFGKTRRRMLVGVLAIVPITIALEWYAGGHFESRHDWLEVLITVSIVGFTAYRDLKKQRRKGESFVLELRSDRLIRRMDGFPPLEIIPSEVTAVIESSSGLAIRTNSRAKTLFVSSTLIDYGDLRGRLLTWAPAGVGEQYSVFTGAINILLMLGFVFLGFGIPLYIAQTPRSELVVPLGLISFLTLFGSILYYWNSPHWPKSARWSVWILLLLPAGAVYLRLVR